MNLFIKYWVFFVCILFFALLLENLSQIYSIITEFELFKGQIWLIVVLVILLIILYFATSFVSTREGKSKVHQFKAYSAIILGFFIIINIVAYLLMSDFKEIQIGPFDYFEKKRLSGELTGPKRLMSNLYDLIRNYWQYVILITGILFVFFGTIYLKNKQIKGNE
jgi:uncharacterized protein YqgC (DUF456 family)